jgi:hypothetical protein
MPAIADSHTEIKRAGRKLGLISAFNKPEYAAEAKRRDEERQREQWNYGWHSRFTIPATAIIPSPK